MFMMYKPILTHLWYNHVTLTSYRISPKSQKHQIGSPSGDRWISTSCFHPPMVQNYQDRICDRIRYCPFGCIWYWDFWLWSRFTKTLGDRKSSRISRYAYQRRSRIDVILCSAYKMMNQWSQLCKFCYSIRSTSQVWSMCQWNSINQSECW